MYSNIFNRISFFSLLLVVTLLPVFFLPFVNISVEIGKGLFLVSGLIISIIFWIIARFSDGKIEVPRSSTLFTGFLMVVVFLVSALFSKALDFTLFGTMLDIGTFWFMFAAFVLMLLSAIVFQDPKNARTVFVGTILVGTIVLLYQAIHLFLPIVFHLQTIPKWLSFGVFPGKTDNLLGSWNAFGVFAGFYVVASLFAIEFFPVSKNIRTALGIFSIFAILMIAIVNYVFVWEILGAFALLVFIYKLSVNSNKSHTEGAKVNFPIFSFVIVLLSLFFFMSSGFIGGMLPQKLGIINNEVSPSFTSTYSVTKSVIQNENFLLGMGPNRFADAWSLYKPNGENPNNNINASQFWDTPFNAGYGLIPTLASTTGVLGILVLIAFFASLIFTGVKWLFFSIKNSVSLETVSFFFLSLYLFFSAFFYYSGVVLFLLGFVFAGVFVGLVATSRKHGQISVTFFNDHRKSFFFMMFLVIAMIVSAAIGFKYIQRFISVPYFNRTLTAQSIPEAETNIGKALSLNTNDLYLRTFSQVYLLKLNSIISKGANSLSDTDKTDLQNSFQQALAGANAAVAYNPKNYLNYQMLGSVYQTAGLMGVKDGYTQAFEQYKKASTLNPANPRIKLILADISVSLGNQKDAKDFVNQAIKLKPDYIDALISLSQIAKNEGNMSDALLYAQRALALSPGSKDIQKYVDSLRGGSSTTTPAPTTDTNTNTPTTNTKKP